MRRAVFAVLFMIAGTASGIGQTPESRVTRLEQWLKAIVRHEPGTTDEAAALVASWSARDVRYLWLDANVVAQLMRDPKKSRFSVKTDQQQNPQPIHYSTSELRRMQALACAAAGILTQPACIEIRASAGLDAELQRLATLASASRLAGDDNFALRRGALLQTDIAMFMPGRSEPIGSFAGGPQRVRIQATDGVAIDYGQQAPHWELARMLLDYVRPRGAANPTPALDAMVRLWYRATATWMQAHEQHDTDHLDRARAIFPNDADILFLSACQHEVYAGAPVQSAIRSIVVPTGVHSDLRSDRSELRQAESLFRRALAASPRMAEARIRLGRVLTLLNRHAEGADELRAALASIADDEQRYYGELFLGAAEAARKNVDAAREAYGRAARLFPTAQSPRIALSELARRASDRGAALREMEAIFSRSDAHGERDDPWWRYYVVQARNANDLLEALRGSFRKAQ